MSKCLASEEGTPIIPRRNISVGATLIHTLIHIHFLSVCNKDGKLMHYSRILLKQNLCQTYLQTFKTDVRFYQSMLKKFCYEKILQ